MQAKLSRISYLMRKGAMILVKGGPVEFMNYATKGLYNRRARLYSIIYHLRSIIPAQKEKLQNLSRIKVEAPNLSEVALDLVQKRLRHRRWKREKTAPFSVLFITSIDEALSARYRVDNLCEQLRKQGIQTCILYNFEIVEHFEEALNFDILVFQRLPMDPEVGNLLSQGRKHGAALVFEIDDYIFDASLYLGQDSVKQTSPAQIAVLATRSARLCETLLACDYFIGTTSTLAKAATDLGRISFEIRNGLSDRQVTLAKKALKQQGHQQKAGGIVQIGYQSGTATHRKDFLVALPALIRILETFPQIKLVIQGFLEIPEALQPFSERIERWPYVSWERLVEVTAQLDLAIAPLEPNNLLNEAKSALKYFESGLVEVPVVASPTEDFLKAIRHGINGFLPNTEEEWYESLRLLISDGSLRRQVGITARQDVLTHYTSIAQSKNTLAVFQAILHDHATRGMPRSPHIASASEVTIKGS